MPSIKESHAHLISVAFLGDMCVFLVFAILGKAEHGVALSQTLFRTALPFAVVWFVASPWLGTYQTSALRNFKGMVWKIPLIWCLCGLVALVARAIIFDRPLILAFALVSIGVQGTSLVGWRFVLSVAVQRLPRH